MPEKDSRKRHSSGKHRHSSGEKKHHHHHNSERKRHHRSSHSRNSEVDPNAEVSIELQPTTDQTPSMNTPSTGMMNLNLASIEADPFRIPENRPHAHTPEMIADLGAINELPIHVQQNSNRDEHGRALVTPRKIQGTEEKPWVDQLKDEIRELRAAGRYGKDFEDSQQEETKASKIAKRLKPHREGGLWRQSLKKIEGKFGSGVGAFFRLMRWVFLLNVFTGLVWLLFVLLPGYSVQNAPVNLDVDTPTTSGVPEYSLELKDFRFIDIVSGDALPGTFLIQSAYPSTAVIRSSTSLIATFFATEVDDKRVYDFRIAFGATVFLVMGGITLFIIRWLRQRTLSGSIDVMVKEDTDFPYSVVLFGTWDHNVSNASAARIMRHGITRRLRELAETRRVKEKKKILSTGEKFFLIFRRVFGWILIFTLAVVFFAVITSFSSKDSSNLMVPVIVATINVMIPFMVRQVVRLQGYGLEEIILQRQLMITYVLKMWNLTVLVLRMFNNDISSLLPWVDEDETPETTSSIIKTLADGDSDEPECTIHQVGREFWTLLFIDLVVSIGYVLIGPRVLTKVTGKPRTFTVSANVIDVIYRQALIWIGTLVAPASVILGIAVTFVLFYLKRHQLMRWCEPEYKAWGAAQGEKFFVVLLSITLLICWVPTVWMLSKLHACGPIQDQDSSYITYFIEALDIVGIPSTSLTLKDLLFTVAKPEYVIPLCCILGVRVYFLSAHRKRLKTRLYQVEYDRDNARREVVKAYARIRQTDSMSMSTPQDRRKSMFVTTSSLLSASSTPQSDAVSKIVQNQLKKK